jgi:hypothetical protein
VRERWFGSTGRKVPEIVVEGDPALPLETALVVDDVSDPDALRRAHDRGVPVVVRASTAAQVKEALARPEVACVVLPPSAAHLRELDLVALTYR